MSNQNRTIELTREVREESLFSRLVRFTHNGLAFVGLCFLTSGTQDTWQALIPKATAAMTAARAEEQPEKKQEQLEGSDFGVLAWCATHYEGKKKPQNPEGVTVDGIDAIQWCGTYYDKFKKKVEKQLEGTQ